MRIAFIGLLFCFQLIGTTEVRAESFTVRCLLQATTLNVKEVHGPRFRSLSFVLDGFSADGAPTAGDGKVSTRMIADRHGLVSGHLFEQASKTPNGYGFLSEEFENKRIGLMLISTGSSEGAQYTGSLVGLSKNSQDPWMRMDGVCDTAIGADGKYHEMFLNGVFPTFEAEANDTFDELSKEAK